MTEFMGKLAACLDAGIGNKGSKWSQKKLAADVGVSQTAVSNWLQAKAIPSQRTFHRMEGLFFRNEADRISIEATDLRAAYLRAKLASRSPLTKKVAEREKKFSLREVWSRVLETKSGEFHTVVQGGSDKTRLGGFAPEQLKFRNTKREIFIAMPSRLIDKIENEKLSYDVHSRADVQVDSGIDLLQSALPTFDLREAIRQSAEEYADLIINRISDEKHQYKPYNKLKYGVWSWTSNFNTGEREEPIAEIQLYVTDFFTNWVVSRVFEKLLRHNKGMFYDMVEYPSLSVKEEMLHLPFLTPSLGLNCMIICKSSTLGDKICFTQLRNQSTNFIQHDKLHVPVNEALNIDDSEHDRTKDPSMDNLWRRMLWEEMGIEHGDGFEFEATDLFLDHTVGEFGIFGILTTSEYSVNQLNQRRWSRSRDAGREFRGNLIEVPLDRASIMEYALSQPRSLNSFTSYAPHLIDLLLARPKIF